MSIQASRQSSAPLRLAINGFGRIGRMIVRALIERHITNMEVVAINDLAPLETNIHLLQWDSIHGPLSHSITHGNNWMDFGCGKTKVFTEKEPARLPWDDLSVDLVLECSGIFTAREKAALHLQAGAKRVLVSAPADGADITVVYGVNHTQIQPNHLVLSNASCTTNCLAPIAWVLHRGIGILSGHMTTVHAFTGDQSLHDRAHRDLARARAATLAMVPTSTGAAKAIGLVLPELHGKLEGTAIRVPTANVSLMDLVFNAARTTSREEVNALMVEAAGQDALRGVLSVNTLPLVSVDFNHNPASAIFDVQQSQVSAGSLVRVLAWYDNEWGFANRMVDVSSFIKNL